MTKHRWLLLAFALLMVSWPASGDPSAQSVGANVEGTQATQLGGTHVLDSVAYCRTTSSTPVACGSVIASQSDHTYALRVTFVVRDVTTHSSTSESMASILCGLVNVGGTVTAINGSTTAICAATTTSNSISGSDAKLADLSLTASISGTVVTFEAGGITGTDTHDWVLQIERVVD